MLLGRSDQFVDTLTEKLLTYALGRGLEPPTRRRSARSSARPRAPTTALPSVIQGIVDERAVSNAERANSEQSRSEVARHVITKMALPRRTFLRGMGTLGVAAPRRDGAGDDRHEGQPAKPARRFGGGLHAATGPT